MVPTGLNTRNNTLNNSLIKKNEEENLKKNDENINNKNEKNKNKGFVSPSKKSKNFLAKKNLKRVTTAITNNKAE